MKNILVIGSTVVDVIISLSHLPKTGEDVNIFGQSMSLGGCAYNVSDTIRHFGVPYILFSPTGTGIYADYIRNNLQKLNVASPIPAPLEANGCCYCLVENSGERTFICNRGAEYHFSPEWFSLLDASEIDSVYLCGLEMEEEDNACILDYLEKHPEFTVYFAPGPHINHLSESCMDRLFAMHPIIHLNETEVTSYTGETSVEAAAGALFAKSKNDVIVTLGAKGAYYRTVSESGYLPGIKCQQIDTIGAGDSHIGAVISCLKLGDPLPEAIRKANKVSAAVVQSPGAQLPDKIFQEIEF